MSITLERGKVLLRNMLFYVKYLISIPFLTSKLQTFYIRQLFSRDKFLMALSWYFLHKAPKASRSISYLIILLELHHAIYQHTPVILCNFYLGVRFSPVPFCFCALFDSPLKCSFALCVPERATECVLHKIVFLKILQISQENTCVEVSF